MKGMKQHRLLSVSYTHLTIRPFEPGEPGYELLLKLEPVFAEIDKKILAKKDSKERNLIKSEESK